MLQGTGSHAGKTVLVAGFCRLLARRGLRVVPFKSQNMSLNAHVAPGGGEMGWAQVMQAEAAGVEPRVEMNPILLKPRGEARSQVVLLGRARRESDARGYYRLAPTLWPAVRRSYERLAREADVVVIEGAGSPAEPNLMRRDLANMRVARMARAPVLLVGDIDRGGVFASLLGTMTLLPPADRRRVRGYVLNKFRGDVRLLAPATDDLRRRTGVPVVGVVPFLRDLALPEEDSVALDHATPARPGLRIAVVRLPQIANFTDFAPLESEPGISLVYAETARDLADAALVILPGSKDTIADLRALRARGLLDAVDAHHRQGGRVLGVCGGFQMLGRTVADAPGRDDPRAKEDHASRPGPLAARGPGLRRLRDPRGRDGRGRARPAAPRGGGPGGRPRLGGRARLGHVPARTLRVRRGAPRGRRRRTRAIIARSARPRTIGSPTPSPRASTRACCASSAGRKRPKILRSSVDRRVSSRNRRRIGGDRCL
jgi:adenosylcobyric acid synthase